MTSHPLSSAAGNPAGARLRRYSVAVPALASHVRPALVLPEQESRRLREVAAQEDVRSGGRFAAGPSGIQVWSGPFDGEGATPGRARHLGSVDWSYDTPVRYYVTIYRAIVTEAGVRAGETTLSVLTAVLSLAGLPVDGDRVSLPEPPLRDPFRRAG